MATPLIRVMSPELNNSLAPISSLIHSARLIAKSPEQLPKLDRVFDTIGERTKHLQNFLEGYARFARLPKPKPAVVAWTPFLDGLRALYPQLTIHEPPKTPGWFDAGQMEQVLINLLKNAIEAGGPPEAVSLTVAEFEGGVRLLVEDRGKGLSPEVLQNALPLDRGSTRPLAVTGPLCVRHATRPLRLNRAWPTPRRRRARTQLRPRSMHRPPRRGRRNSSTRAAQCGRPPVRRGDAFRPPPPDPPTRRRSRWRSENGALGRQRAQRAFELQRRSIAGSLPLALAAPPA